MKLVLNWLLAALSGLAIGGPAQAADEIVLDYRDHAFRSGQAFYPAPEREKIAAALANAPADVRQALGQEFVILGDAQVDVPKGGDRETVYLLSGRAPVAACLPSALMRQIVRVEEGRVSGSS